MRILFYNNFDVYLSKFTCQLLSSMRKTWKSLQHDVHISSDHCGLWEFETPLPLLETRLSFRWMPSAVNESTNAFQGLHTQQTFWLRCTCCCSYKHISVGKWFQYYLSTVCLIYAQTSVTKIEYQLFMFCRTLGIKSLTWKDTKLFYNPRTHADTYSKHTQPGRIRNSRSSPLAKGWHSGRNHQHPSLPPR